MPEDPPAQDRRPARRDHPPHQRGRVRLIALRRLAAHSAFGAVLALAGCSTAPPAPDLSAPPSGTGDLHFTTREVYYDLAGPGGADIARQLEAHSRANQGRLAETRWNLKTDLGFSSSPGTGCELSKLDVNVSMEIELPRWQGAAQSPLREQWAKFEAAARVHEKGHYEHGVAAGNEVAAALRGLKAADCDTLSKMTSSRTQAVVDKYGKLDERYDAETRHGILQGTVWKYSE